MVPSVIKNNNFLKLWLAQVLTQTSLNMLYYLLTIKVWETTESNSGLFLFFLIFPFPAIIFGPMAGVLVDRWDTKKALVLTNLGRTLMIPFFIFILKNPFAVLPLIFLISTVTQFFVPAEGSVIPGLVEKKQLLSANSLFTMTINIAMIVGFVISGPVVRIFGDRGAVIIVLIAFLISTGLITQIPKVPGKSGGEGLGAIFRELGVAVKFIWKTALVRQAVIAITVVNSFILMLSALGPGYVSQILNMEVVDAGII